MSAIVGLYNLDDCPVPRAKIERMVDVLAHRGPDGAAIWCESAVALGHRMLYTTPESVQEVLPLVDKTHDLFLTADARIDNREELMGALGLSNVISGGLSDSQLILLAYVEWGEDCVGHLVGDFAFALWDEHKQRLFCARDHFGVKPFYYYHAPGRFFAFGTEIKALWCLEEVPQQLNEIRVADYLLSELEDPAATFYKNILRLPAAHFLSVTKTTIEVRQYWELDPEPELRLTSDEEYANQFREIFTEAVRCRLRSALPVGSMLSGGLDSSSVACVARNLLTAENQGPLPTYSGVYKDVPECDESNFINVVIQQGGFEPHFHRSDQQGPLHNIERVLWYEDEPFPAPNLCIGWKVYSEANKSGTRVLLDGHGGDETVSFGVEHIKQLITRKHWRTLHRELMALSNNHFLERKAAWKLLLSAVCRHTWPISLLLQLSSRLKDVLKSLLAVIGWSRITREPKHERRNFLNPEYIRAYNLEQLQQERQTRKKERPHVPDSRKDHYRQLTGGIGSLAFEVLDKAAAAASIEPRYPFCDKRLVEFCLSVPVEQKLSHGWTRSLLRRAMTGILPIEIQWRKDKTNFFANFARGLLNLDYELLDRFTASDTKPQATFVNVEMMRKLHMAVAEEGSVRPQEDFVLLLNFAIFSQWLREPFKTRLKQDATGQLLKENIYQARTTFNKPSGSTLVAPLHQIDL